MPSLVLLSVASCLPVGRDPNAASVLLITVDSLRADHVGAYGSEHGLTPNIDRFAATATTFVRAYTSTPATLPAHATLFTGRNPPAHGVRLDGDHLLSTDQVTLAERFLAEGYSTVGIASSFAVRRLFGLNQGFEQWNEPGVPSRTGGDQRNADQAVNAAIEAIAGLDFHRPGFVWVHLVDPSFPYDPPPEWGQDHPEDPYRGEIAFVDDEIGRLLVSWDMRFGTDRSIVVIAGAHGEALGEGGERTHGYLLEDGVVRVPLLVRGPGMPVGARVKDPVGLVDVAPTLLDLTGLGLHPGLQGDDLRDGGSDLVYNESLLGRYSFGLTPLMAYTGPNGRYVHGSWGAFHPVAGDRILPFGVRTSATDDQVHQLFRLRQGLGEKAPTEVALDPTAMTMLASLGYVGGDPAGDSSRGMDPRDFVDTLPQIGRAQRLMGIGLHGEARTLLDDLSRRFPDAFGVGLLEAQWLHKQGRLAEADRAFQRLYNRHPSNTVALHLASVAVARSRWMEATSWYNAVIRFDPDSPEALSGLARCAHVRGDNEAADDIYAKMVAHLPDDPYTALVGAELGLRDMQPQAVLPLALQAVHLMPYSAWAHAVHGRVLWDLGRPDASLAALETALRLDPFAAPLRIELVSNLLSIERDPEAVRVSAPLARMLTDHPGAQEVYRLAKDSLDELDRRRLRRDRARGLDGRPPPIKVKPAPAAPPAGGEGSPDGAAAP